MTFVSDDSDEEEEAAVATLPLLLLLERKEDDEVVANDFKDVLLYSFCASIIITSAFLDEDDEKIIVPF
jgi:hypothetical protein